MQFLPPDMIRMLVPNMDVIDILDKCKVNRQFNAAICLNEPFWRNLAREKGLIMPSNVPISEIKKRLVQLEIPRVVDVYWLGVRDRNREPSEFPTYAFESIFPAPEGIVTLDEFLDLMKDTYARYYDQIPPNDEEELNKILSVEDFNQKIEDLRVNLPEFSILDATVNNEDDIVYDEYFVFRDETGQRILKLMSTQYARLGPEHMILYIPLEGFPLFEKLSKRKLEPVTDSMISQAYNNYFPNIGFEYPDWRSRYILGSGRDPVRTIDGVDFHIRKY